MCLLLCERLTWRCMCLCLSVTLMIPSFIYGPFYWLIYHLNITTLNSTAKTEPDYAFLFFSLIVISSIVFASSVFLWISVRRRSVLANNLYVLLTGVQMALAFLVATGVFLWISVRRRSVLANNLYVLLTGVQMALAFLVATSSIVFASSVFLWISVRRRSVLANNLYVLLTGVQMALAFLVATGFLARCTIFDEHCFDHRPKREGNDRKAAAILFCIALVYEFLNLSFIFVACSYKVAVLQKPISVQIKL